MQVQVQGKLKSNVKSGTFTVPISITEAILETSACSGPTIEVLTKGELTADKLANVDIYTKRGAIIDEKSTILLNITSGSLTMQGRKLLATSASGINLYYGNYDPRSYYAPYMNVSLPIAISGTVANDASGSYSLIPKVTTTGITDCTTGATINVVIGSLNCGSDLEYPSNKAIRYNQQITVTLDALSSKYPLKNNQVLGSSNGITITYIGTETVLQPNTSYTLDVLVSSGNVIKPTSEYITPLNTLINTVGVGIESCDMKVKVVDYGYFSPVTVDIPIPVVVEGEETEVSKDLNELIQIPLTFTASSKSVTISNGDVLGTYSASGKTYKVTAQTSTPIVIDTPTAQPVNIPAVLTGVKDVAGKSYSISLDKVVGIKSANVTVRFVEGN